MSKDFQENDRITPDITSFGNNVRDAEVSYGTRNDRERELERIIERLSYEKQSLEFQLKSLQINTNNVLSEKAQTISRLEDSNKNYQKLAIYHQDRYENATETLATMKAKHIQVTNDLHQQLEKQRFTIQNLEMDLSQKEDIIVVLKNNNDQSSNIPKSETKNLKEIILTLEEADANKTRRLEECHEQEKAFVEKIIKLETEVARLTSLSYGSETFEALNTEFSTVSKRLVELETLNQRLSRDLERSRAISQDVELLKMEKTSLLSKAEQVEQLLEINIKLEIENTNLRAEREAWTCYLDQKSPFNAQTPSSIIYQLTKEAEKAKQIEYIQQYYQSQLDQLKTLYEGLEIHMEELKKQAIENDQLHAMDEAAREMINNSNRSLQKRIVMLENHLALYDHEEEAVMDEEKYDRIKTQRILELQQQLKEYDQEILAKDQQIADLSTREKPTIYISNGPYDRLTSGSKLTEFIANIVNKEQQYFAELQEKLTNEAILQKRIKSANDMIAQLRTSLASLQQHIPVPELTTMEHNIISNNNAVTAETQTEDTRILTLLDNPTSNEYAIRKSLLERLEKENQDLLEQLNSANSNIPLSTIENLQAKNQELQETIKSREKRIQRLHSIWESKIKTTSDQIRRLLGYNVIFRNDDLTRLESVFVDPSELSFLVKNVDDDHEVTILRMVGTKKDQYMQELEDIYQVYIVEDRNIPAFLNAAAREFYIQYREQQMEDIEYDEQPMEDDDEEGIEPYDEDTQTYTNDDDDVTINIDDDITIHTDDDEDEN